MSVEPEPDDLGELIDDLAEDDPGLELRVASAVERRELARLLTAQRSETDHS